MADKYDFTYSNITEIDENEKNALAINMAPYGLEKLVVVSNENNINMNIMFYEELCLTEALRELQSDAMFVYQNYNKIKELHTENEYGWFHYVHVCLSMVCGLHVLFNRELVAAPVRKKQKNPD